MPAKRNHKTLSLTDKNTILKRLDKGESGKALAREFQVGTSTISDIKKKREPIEGKKLRKHFLYRKVHSYITSIIAVLLKIVLLDLVPEKH
jgi:hypothetical protein